MWSFQPIPIESAGGFWHFMFSTLCNKGSPFSSLFEPVFFSDSEIPGETKMFDGFRAIHQDDI